MKIIHKIQLSQRFRQLICIFCLMVIAIWAKQILFQGIVFDDLYMHNPAEAFKFYAGTLAVSLCLASFVFIIPGKWWTIFLLFTIDVWFMSQMIYYRAWGIWMNVETMRLADNMEGFWGSVWTYMNWTTIIYIVLTIIYGCALGGLCLWWKKKNGEPSRYKCNWEIWLVILAFAYLYVPIRQYPIWKRSKLENAQVLNPYSDPIRYQWYCYKPLFRPFNPVLEKAKVSYEAGMMNEWEDAYIRRQGMIDYAMAMVAFDCHYRYWKDKGDDILNGSATLTEQELQRLKLCMQDEQPWTPERNLIVVLVESFESWAIDYAWKGVPAMPNMQRFMNEQPVFSADKITSEAKGGGSGDGQMIIHTGLLPLVSGAACRLYGDNVYPNMAHYYPHSVLINPAPGAWNQDVVTPQYGIKELYDIHKKGTTDADVFDEMIRRVRTEESPYYMMGITLSSHAPFGYAANVSFETDEQMPSNMRNYIKCMHYFDEQFGRLYEELKNTGQLSKTDIVITGDHVVFTGMMLKEISKYAQLHNIPIAEGKNYCPLIIHSPTFTEDVKCEDVAYQMDVFPTIMATSGGGAYFWKGFGVNLTDSVARKNRMIHEDEAFQLSDKLIRSNYFETLENGN